MGSTRLLLHFYNAKLLPGPFLGFQINSIFSELPNFSNKQYILSFQTFQINSIFSELPNFYNGGTPCGHCVCTTILSSVNIQVTFSWKSARNLSLLAIIIPTVLLGVGHRVSSSSRNFTSAMWTHAMVVAEMSYVK